MQETKEFSIKSKCSEIENDLMRHNSKEAYRVVITERKEKVNIIHGKKWNCLIEEDVIMNRWTAYCTELYNRPVTGDISVLNVINENKEPQLSIRRHEIDTAVHSLKIGKSPGIDNIPAELIRTGDDKIIDVLTTICNSIWKTGK